MSASLSEESDELSGGLVGSSMGGLDARFFPPNNSFPLLFRAFVFLSALDFNALLCFVFFVDFGGSSSSFVRVLFELAREVERPLTVDLPSTTFSRGATFLSARRPTRLLSSFVDMASDKASDCERATMETQLLYLQPSRRIDKAED
jgi:hypothetical protein